MCVCPFPAIHQVRSCAELALKAVADGMCVVIGMQSTGEAGTTLAREENGDEMDDFVSAPKMILHRLIKLNLFKFKPGTVFDERAIKKMQAMVGATGRDEGSGFMEGARGALWDRGEMGKELLLSLPSGLPRLQGVAGPALV